MSFDIKVGAAESRFDIFVLQSELMLAQEIKHACWEDDYEGKDQDACH